ncbi:sugar ABC transporter substrate-binding protein [Anaerosacchariphilus sp. NSJ-68]|uniref:Sugar ABC transporter substrate-binding protein n=2 Tax=Lachnospiraceae TaxID=186803 RepID=A0A923LFH4_9FIRM|nr:MULTISPECIES: sugar ABC transporter substrate-binding protein [Lachnospiraceae]MBC5661154.1 sugar ABC transporter substrate-binding protein [Anaerosacchariphilus hominis]MBC5697636.1 sugar ABC transporter substrate-binding protein [Roseburia difficilis]
MKKRTLTSLLLTGALAVSLLAGCGSGGGAASDTQTATGTETADAGGDNLEKSKAIDWQSAKDNAGNPLFIDTFVPDTPEKPADPDSLPETDELHWFNFEYPYAEIQKLEQPASPADGCIGKKLILLKNGDHPYHTAYIEATKQAAEIFGMEVEVMSANWDVNIQTQQVDQAINEAPDLIIYNPVDQETSVTHLRKMYDAGIPVIGSNVMPSNEGFQYLLSFCGPADWDQSKLLAQYMAEKAGYKGNYCVITHNPGGSAYYARAYGVITELAKIAPDMVCLDIQSPGTDSAENVKQVVSDWITKYGDDLDVIFTSETTVQATGSIEACEAAGRSDILIGGIDNSETALNYIKEGKLTCATNQPPMQDGALPVLLAAKWFNGETIDDYVFMEPAVINADNVEDFLPAQW